MEIEVFKRTVTGYESVTLIDQFSSLIVNKRYYKTSDFQLQVAPTSEVIEYLVPSNCLLIEGVFYYIDNVNYDQKAHTLVVSGVSLFGLLKNRVIWSDFSLYQTPLFICQQILLENVTSPSNPNRIIDLFSVTADTITQSSIQYQNSYGMVRDEIESLCETYDFGFKETPTDTLEPSCVIHFYKGTDKSDWIEFSIDNEMLFSETYETNDYDESTTALVAGEGEGTDRTIITLNDGLTGLDRKELYVDARDLQSTVGETILTTEEYNNLLTTRGTEKLSEKQAILLLDGDVNINSELYKYGVDYTLGDTVSVYSKRFNVSTTKTLTEMQETWDSKGHFLTPTFGKRTPTIIDYIKRK